MDILVMVPFKEHHMAQIREAAGPGANVVQKQLERKYLPPLRQTF